MVFTCFAQYVSLKKCGYNIYALHLSYKYTWLIVLEQVPQELNVRCIKHGIMHDLFVCLSFGNIYFCGWFNRIWHWGWKLLLIVRYCLKATGYFALVF